MCLFQSHKYIGMPNEEMRILIAPGYAWAHQHNLLAPMTPQSQQANTLLVVLLFTSSCTLWSQLMHLFALCRKEAPYSRKHKYKANWIGLLLLTWVCVKQQNYFFLLYTNAVLKPPRQTKTCIFPSAFGVDLCMSECVHAYPYMVFVFPHLTGFFGVP